MPDGYGRWASYLGQLFSAAIDRDPMIAMAVKVVLALFIGGLALLVLALVVRIRQGDPKQKAKTDKKKERKHPKTSGFERLLQWISPPADPWIVGDIIVDFTWLAHCLVWGTTGSGKSSFVRYRILRPYLGLPGLVLNLARVFLHITAPIWGVLMGIDVDTLIPIRQKRGCLIFAGNMSKPFRAAVLWLIEHGYPCLIWEPDPIRGQGFGLDVLEGPPDAAAQRLIKMQPTATGDTGLRSGSVEGMLVDTIYRLDEQGKQRTFEDILTTIRNVGIRDLNEDGKPDGPARPMTNQERAGLENWCTRFSTLRRRLGACIGSDVKLSEYLEAGYVIFIQGSSYRNPNTINELTNLIVYYVMWLVGSVGNFDFLIDEPGAVEKGTFTRLLTATRAQGVKIFVCPQSLEQIDKTLREMCTTSLLLGTANGAHEAQDLQSDMVKDDIEAVDFVLLKPTNWKERVVFWRGRRGLRSCTGYLLDNGRLDLVKTKPLGCKNCGKRDAKGHKLAHKRGCGLEIIDRWPTGSIPKISAETVSPLKPGTTLSKGESGEEGETEGEGEDGVPEWAKVDEQALNIYGNVTVKESHRLSNYSLNNRGRPLAKWNGQQWLTYALMLALSEGRDLSEVRERMADMSAEGLTCDHMCRDLDPTMSAEDEAKCQEVSHLSWRTRGGHARIEWKRRRRRGNSQKEVAAV
jgi:hypothetical protein